MREKSAQPLHPDPAKRTSESLELGSVHSETAPATTETHRTTLLELPSSWLDRLLALARGMPDDQGADGAVRAAVQAVASILPELAVGGRLPSEQGEPRRVVFSEPPQSNEQARTDRLFPEAHFERIVALPGMGGWLHAAGDDAQLDDDRSPTVILLERAAGVLSDGLLRVQKQERAAKAVAELEAMQREIVQAEKLASLGQMAAGMVHELNNPLTSIVAYTDYLLRRGDKLDPQDTERIRRIAESANRMLRFTRDLVSYARPASEIAVPVPLHGVLDRALAFCEHEIVTAGVVVERAYDERVSVVRGKPEQLAQVFVNLFTNACHAMAAREGGAGDVAKLTLTTEPIGPDSVRITVDDTGHGIPDENLGRVFAPFFTTKGAGQGTGLGLSIVKSIVLAHAGDISVESRAPGTHGTHGTRFIILLPLMPE
jgi:two-component system NtrC family sensor kinase